jgi:hypothetical protein
MDDFKRGLYMEALEAMKQNETGICKLLYAILDNLNEEIINLPKYRIAEIFQEFTALEEKGVEWMYAPGTAIEDNIYSEIWFRLYWWNFPDRSNMVTPYGKKSPRVSMLEFILNNR